MEAGSVANEGVLDSLRRRAAAEPKRIVLPESGDPRVVDAARKLAANKLVVPVLLERCHDVPDGVEFIDTSDTQIRQSCIDKLIANRKHKGMTAETAELALQDPLMFASTLVSTGVVDGCVAGSVATTASVIRAGLYGMGTKPGAKLVSSFFLMELAGRCLTYADCGVVPQPDAEQLSEIAIASAASHRLLTGHEPLVAMLSFSTLGSADHESVQKVRDALAIVKEKEPGLKIDGELQFDAAFVDSVAARKAPNSAVAGKANVFVFPDLNSGNIAYKITERLAGATALGPLLQGLAQPFMDLSRGCSVDDIADVAVIAAVMASA